MSRFSSLPAAVRWGVPPAALLTCVGLLGWSWSLPEDVEPPRPTGKAVAACEALDRALPETVLGHRRDDPSPASPYTAAWSSSPRTVLVCGSERPDYLNDDPLASAPEVNDVQFGMSARPGGGYHFVTTLRDAYVEIRVPEGAYPNYADPLSSFTDAIKAAVPGWLAQQPGTANG
ncbi:DUF3515 domain-containing protein [Kitasatospora sp. NPDC096147]|uniref:DUF3515 domain-containing protein n=1 Tax=Kitasatospora sp. NPDC096147 TaxID=3364093 RepID=UPI00380D3CE0